MAEEFESTAGNSKMLAPATSVGETKSKATGFDPICFRCYMCLETFWDPSVFYQHLSQHKEKFQLIYFQQKLENNELLKEPPMFGYQQQLQNNFPIISQEAVNTVQQPQPQLLSYPQQLDDKGQEYNRQLYWEQPKQGQQYYPSMQLQQDPTCSYIMNSPKWPHVYHSLEQQYPVVFQQIDQQYLNQQYPATEHFAQTSWVYPPQPQPQFYSMPHSNYMQSYTQKQFFNYSEQQDANVYGTQPQPSTSNVLLAHEQNEATNSNFNNNNRRNDAKSNTNNRTHRGWYKNNSKTSSNIDGHVNNQINNANRYVTYSGNNTADNKINPGGNSKPPKKNKKNDNFGYYGNIRNSDNFNLKTKKNNSIIPK